MTHDLSSTDATANWVVDTLGDLKAQDVLVLDVTGITTITDRMIIASGTSGRHVRAMANKVAAEIKTLTDTTPAIEGAEDAEWVLVDLGQVIIHLMLPRARAFYNLEGLWRDEDIAAAQTAAQQPTPIT